MKALKIFNNESSTKIPGIWAVPRKDSKQYFVVKKIMKRTPLEERKPKKVEPKPQLRQKTIDETLRGR